jgi:hypothetical protein
MPPAGFGRMDGVNMDCSLFALATMLSRDTGDGSAALLIEILDKNDIEMMHEFVAFIKQSLVGK